MVVDALAGTGRKTVKHMQKSAEEVNESAAMHGVVNRQKKPIDAELRKNISLLVGIGRRILIMLKCIVDLICLVLFRIVYIESRPTFHLGFSTGETIDVNVNNFHRLMQGKRPSSLPEVPHLLAYV